MEWVKKLNLVNTGFVVGAEFLVWLSSYQFRKKGFCP
jgi:hypothetical protein